MNRVSVLALLAALILPLPVLAGPVNVNTADAKTIARELTGIGLSRAQAIVDYREKNGPFKSPDDLAKVKGVGMKVVEQNRANIKTDKGDKAKTVSNGKDKAASSD